MDIKPLAGHRAWMSITAALIAANVLVAIAMLVFGAGWSHSSGTVQMAWGANFGPATKDGEWWRLGTAMFLHFGVVHLATNMLALWDSGRLVEAVFGRRRFFAIYLVSGLAGNLVSLIARADLAVSGGASGAIFGVYGAFLVYLLHERRRLHPIDFKWMFWGAAVFSSILLALGFFIPGIDNAAHAGGLAAGAICGFVLMPLSADRNDARRRTRWVVGIGFVFGASILIANLPAPQYRWSEEEVARGEIRAFIEEDARINARLRGILAGERDAGISFDQLAGDIEADVVSSYEQSFEQLSELHLSSQLPSAPTLERLRRYAETRREASQALVEGLRNRDQQQVNEALDSSRRAVQQLN